MEQSNRPNSLPPRLPHGPLTFAPILKQIIWGGRLLGDRLGKPIGDQSDYAESWELVDRSVDQSVVNAGPLAGLTLSQLLAHYNREMLGRHSGLMAFPLLAKYLDCNRVLSVQVHPDDAYATRMPIPDLGKTEAWYIVEAAPNSIIYAGLKSGMDRSRLAQAIETGQADKALHTIRPVAGQCIFIPAGTVHALGDGLLVAEIQQSSDTTFRLFDWNRTDANGKARPLHIEKSLEVTNFEQGPIEPQSPVDQPNGWHLLVECDKFVLRRAKFQSKQSNCFLTGGDDAIVLLMIISGTVVLNGESWESRIFRAGDTVLLPASSGLCEMELLSAETTVLEVRLP